MLLALSAQAPASRSQVLNHAKVLALCLLIFTIPLAISFAFVEALKLDMWMMVIISSSILTSIQVIGKFFHFYCRGQWASSTNLYASLPFNGSLK